MNAPARPQQEHPLVRLKKDVASHGRTFAALLKADDKELHRYMAEVYQATAANPKLLEAHRGSLLQAIGEGAAMGLSINPNLGEAYLIPRSRNVGDRDNPKWVQWVYFQRGYKGLIKLAYRSGLIESIYADVVYRGEHYVRRGGTDPMIDHIPDDVDGKRTGDYEDIVAAYAVVWIKGSAKPLFRAVSRAELDKARSMSGNGSKSKKRKVDNDKPNVSDTWVSHPEAMCRKTALIRISSVLPRHDALREFHMAAERDNMIEVGREVPNLPELEKLRPLADDPDDLNALEANSIEAMEAAPAD